MTTDRPPPTPAEPTTGPVKLVLHAGLFANQQAQLAFLGAFVTIATVALVIAYFLGPGARVAGSRFVEVMTCGFGVVLALRDGTEVTVRTHPDWAPRTDDESTAMLATALRGRLASRLGR
jgi:hypothetical protein